MINRTRCIVCKEMSVGGSTLWTHGAQVFTCTECTTKGRVPSAEALTAAKDTLKAVVAEEIELTPNVVFIVEALFRRFNLSSTDTLFRETNSSIYEATPNVEVAAAKLQFTELGNRLRRRTLTRS